MTDSNLLLEEHLKMLRLPVFIESYQRTADECSRSNHSYPQYLAQLAEDEVNQRTQRAIERRIRIAKFPLTKTLDEFDFASQPTLNKQQILQLAQCHFIADKSNLVFVGSPGTGKTHLSIAIAHKARAIALKIHWLWHDSFRPCIMGISKPHHKNFVDIRGYELAECGKSQIGKPAP